MLRRSCSTDSADQYSIASSYRGHHDSMSSCCTTDDTITTSASCTVSGSVISSASSMPSSAIHVVSPGSPRSSISRRNYPKKKHSDFNDGSREKFTSVSNCNTSHDVNVDNCYGDNNIDSSKNRKTSLEVRLYRAEATILELRQRLEEKATNNAPLCKGSCSCSCTKNLQNQVKVLKSTVKDVRSELDHALNSAVTRSANITALTLQNRDLQIELEELEEARKRDLIASNNAMEKAHKEYLASREEHDSKFQEIKKLFEMEQGQRKELLKELQELQKRVDEEKSMKIGMEEDIDRFVDELEERDHEIDALKYRNSDLELKMREMTYTVKQYEEMKAQHSLLEESYSAARNEIQLLRLQRDAHEEEIRVWSKTLKKNSVGEGESEKLKEELRSIKRLLEEKQRDCEELKYDKTNIELISRERVAKSQQECKELKEDKDALERRFRQETKILQLEKNEIEQELRDKCNLLKQRDNELKKAKQIATSAFVTIGQLEEQLIVEGELNFNNDTFPEFENKSNFPLDEI